MIDPVILRTEPDLIRESQRRRGESVELVDELVAADEAKRSAQSAFDELRNQQKTLGKQIGPLQGALKKASDDDRARLQDELDGLMATAQQLAEQVKEAERAANAATDVLDELWLQVSNIVNLDSPVGGEEAFRVLDHVGTPRDFAAEGFEPRDHLALGELLGAIDVERGAKVSGSRFYFLTGVGARLELALINLALTKAMGWGFTPMLPPALVKPSAMEGTGFLGQAAQDVYHLPADDLYLVGTSEVAMAAYHSEEILDAATLPRHYVGYSPCFRREAGSYGKDTRGIFRVHWFDKVEMFVYCDPAEAEAEHEKLLGFEKDFITALEIPFQVLEVASGDLGLSAARKYDCYGWLPTQGKYREITSTSNCTEFQARRLNIRMRDADGVRSVATLNGTLCAMTRMIIMLLENHQQADGSIYIPVALRPYLGGLEYLRPAG